MPFAIKKIYFYLVYVFFNTIFVFLIKKNMDYHNYKKKVDAVKELGERIGYGNMMSIASYLWRKSMIEKNYPVSGVFIPAVEDAINDEWKDFIEKNVSQQYELVSAVLS